MWLNVNMTGVQSNAAPDDTAHGPKVIAGWPSVPALRLMLDAYDLDLEQEFDWASLLAANPNTGSVGDYRTGHRVTLRCSVRPEARLRPTRRSGEQVAVVPTVTRRGWRPARPKAQVPIGTSRSARLRAALTAGRAAPGMPAHRQPS